MINIKYYEKEGFEKEYSNYLFNVINGNLSLNCPYKDPDAISSNNISFYNDITNYLKISNSNLVKERKIDNLNNIVFSKNENELKPFVTIDNKIIYLTSDQFGYTAPRYDKEYNKYYGFNNENRKYYPYHKYIEYSKDKNIACKNVAKWINVTRTIGGSFIWPTLNGTSLYNMSRGGKRIEDRVDLTLLEIKHFYDVLNENKENNDNNKERSNYKENLIKEYNQKYAINNVNPVLFSCKDKDLIYTWLETFKTFENYVEFFMFEDFLKFDENGKVVGVINIFSKNNDILKDDDKGYFIANLECNEIEEDVVSELENMFIKLTNCIIKRSIKIEKIKNDIVTNLCNIM